MGAAGLRTALAGRSAGLRAVELLALAAVVGLALSLRLANPEHYTGSFDEGVRMEQLLLMEHGYRPFKDIFASQGPLLLDLLYPLYLALGRTLGAARLGVSLFSLVGVVGAWWALRPFGRLAGLGAALVLALSPGYLDGSRLALAEIPSLAPAILALGCGLRWQRGGRAGWLYAAALLGTLAVLVKPMAVAGLAPLVLLTLLRPDRCWRVLGLALLLAAAAALAVLLLLDLPRVLEVLGAYRGAVQRAPGAAAAANFTLVAKVLGAERLGFLALAGSGALLGLLTWPRATLALIAWPVAVLGLFLLYTDLADKHVVYLVPPLALLGGLGLGAAASLAAVVWRRRAADPGDQPAPVASRAPVHLIAAAPVFLAVLLYASGAPTLWRANQELLRDADDRQRRDYAGTMEQAVLMAALAQPHEFVLTDHPIAAFEARRLVPPWLVDTSGTRVDARSLTAEVAIREASRYQPRVVVTWRRRLGKLDDFSHWLSADYRLLKTYPGSDPANPLQLYVHASLEPRARALLAQR